MSAESLVVSATARRYQRLTVFGHQLAALQALDPSLAAVSIATRDTPTGCWLAFNSIGVTARVVRTLRQQGIGVTHEVVDENGVPVGDIDRDALAATHQRLLD